MHKKASSSKSLKVVSRRVAQSDPLHPTPQPNIGVPPLGYKRNYFDEVFKAWWGLNDECLAV